MQADRRELLWLRKDVAAGDVVTVTRIDRLARSTFDLFAIVKQIVDAGGQFRLLADVERDLIRARARARARTRTRTAERRSRAMTHRQHIGRPPKLMGQQQEDARKRRAESAMSKELADSYNVGRATISRLAG